MWQKIRDAPVAEGHSTAAARPHAIYPRAIPANDDQNKPLFVLVILYAGMKARHALERTQVDVYLSVLRRGGGGARDATSTDGDVQSLEIVSEIGEDEAVVCADLVCGMVVGVEGSAVEVGVGGGGILWVGDDGGHGGERARSERADSSRKRLYLDRTGEAAIRSRRQFELGDKNCPPIDRGCICSRLPRRPTHVPRTHRRGGLE